MTFWINQMPAKMRKKTGSPRSERQKLLYGSVYCDAKLR